MLSLHSLESAVTLTGSNPPAVTLSLTIAMRDEVEVELRRKLLPNFFGFGF